MRYAPLAHAMDWERRVGNGWMDVERGGTTLQYS